MKLSSWRNLLILIAIVATLWAISQPMEAEAAPYDPEQTYLIPYDGDTLVIGTIDWLMAGYVCAEVQEGDTVILASSGGIVQAAYMITDCLRAKKVKVMVSHAYSIAPMIAFAGVEVCLSGAEDGIIGTHQPAYALEGLVMSDYDFAEIYFIIQYDILLSGGTFRAAYDFTQYMHSAPHTPHYKDLAIIPKAKFAEMLGAKYKGICQAVNGVYAS